MEAERFDESDALILGVGKQPVERRRAYYTSLIIAALLGAPLSERNFRRVLKANSANIKADKQTLSLTEAGERKHGELIARLEEAGNSDVLEVLEVLKKVRLPDLKVLKDFVLGKPVKMAKHGKRPPFEITAGKNGITLVEKDSPPTA